MDLSEDDRLRYSRNLMLPEIGAEGQKKFGSISVLVVGCGALGTISSMYLGASGCRSFGLVDFDTVDVSNLQRQLAFGINDVGRKKTESLQNKLQAIDPLIKCELYDCFLTRKSVSDIIKKYDVVIEGSDNPETKYMVTDCCAKYGVPYVLGGISGVSGQVMSYTKGNATYRDFFPEGMDAEGYTPCALGGVLGPLPGIIGSIQAIEVIKLTVGFGTPLTNSILMIDASTMTFQKLIF